MGNVAKPITVTTFDIAENTEWWLLLSILSTRSAHSCFILLTSFSLMKSCSTAKPSRWNYTDHTSCYWKITYNNSCITTDTIVMPIIWLILGLESSDMHRLSSATSCYHKDD